MVETRKSTELFGLGPAITEEDSEINGSRLPTYGQVLRCFLYYYKNQRKGTAAKSVFPKIEMHYIKAGITMSSNCHCCEKIESLYEKDYKKDILNMQINRRAKPFAILKISKFKEKLKMTMPLWHKNALNLLSGPTKTEDTNFLLSMMGKHPTIEPRQANYAGRDKVTQQKVATLQLRKERLKKYQKDQRKELENIADIDRTTENDDEMEEELPQYQPELDQSDKLNDTITLVLKRDFFTDPRIITTAARAQISPAAEYALFSALLEVNINYIVSFKFIYRYTCQPVW